MQEQEKQNNAVDIGTSDQSSAAPIAINDSRLVVQLENTKKLLHETTDALLRSRAEIENGRRRSYEDIEKAKKFAIESFAESMVPVKDSLEMALMLDWPSFEAIREGVEITLKQLNSAFERH